MHHSSSSSSRILHLQIPTPKKFVHIQKLDSTVCKTQEVRSADKHIFYSVHSCRVTKQSSWILRLGLVRCICFPESKIGLQGLFQLKDWELGNYDFITHLKSQVIFFLVKTNHRWCEANSSPNPSLFPSQDYAVKTTDKISVPVS